MEESDPGPRALWVALGVVLAAGVWGLCTLERSERARAREAARAYLQQSGQEAQAAGVPAEANPYRDEWSRVQRRKR